MKTQKELLKEIYDMVLKVIEPGWLEFTLNYRVEGTRSKEINTYLIEEGGSLKEKSLAFMPELNRLLRELRKLLAKEKEEFTGCRIQVKSSGEFNADYTYEQIDWEQPGSWNYNVNT